MAERSHTHVYSRSALTVFTVWRAVPLCCNAMLAQRMLAQRASHTAARAEYHTLACPRSSARPSDHHIWSDIGLATQTTKTSRQRGAWDVPANYVKVAFNVSSLERPQRPPPCDRSWSPRERVGRLAAQLGNNRLLLPTFRRFLSCGSTLVTR